MTILRPHRLQGTGRWRCAVLQVECTRREAERLARLVDEFHPEVDVVGVAWPSDGHRSPHEAVRARITVQVHERDLQRLDVLVAERLGTTLRGGTGVTGGTPC